MNVLCRTCYFTSNSTMRKTDFMKMINASFPAGGLTCSFQDQQLSEYIQIKYRSAGPLPVKKAVQHVGKQDQSLWVMGPNVHIDSLGNLIDKNNSPYVWIGHLYSGPGVAPQATACNINLPLSVEPLSLMLEGLKQIMQHNYYPSLMVLGACTMAFHYLTIQAKFGNCPIPIIFGLPRTGKTTALRCGLSMMGIAESQFWSGRSKEKYLQLCCDSYLPLGIDDPRSKASISDLCMALFNSAQEGTISRGTNKPMSTAI